MWRKAVLWEGTVHHTIVLRGGDTEAEEEALREEDTVAVEEAMEDARNRIMVAFWFETFRLIAGNFILSVLTSDLW